MILTKREIYLLEVIDKPRVNNPYFLEETMENSIMFDTKFLFILKAEELRLYLYLLSWAIPPSIERVEADLKLSRASVYRLLRGLKDKGILFVGKLHTETIARRLLDERHVG